jgi:hypothetical protein
MARELSSRGVHRIVRGADHLSIVVERRHAQQLADVVLGVVEETVA